MMVRGRGARTAAAPTPAGRIGVRAMPYFVTLVWGVLKRHQILALTLVVFAATLTGAVLFSLTQHVSLFTGFYWAVVTVTTVGYGDVTPHNAAGRWIAMGTMLATIPIAGAAFAGWAAALVSVRVRRMFGMSLDALRDHVVVLGYTPLLTHVLPDLLAAHDSVVLVAAVDAAQLPESVPFIAGDPTNPHVLAKARLARARQVIVVGNTDAEVLMTAVEARHLAPEVPLFALTQSRKAAQALKDLGVPQAVAAQDLLGHMLAKSWEAPHTAELMGALIGSSRTVIQEKPVPADWIGQPLAGVRDRAPGLFLGLVHQNHIELGVEDNPTVTDGDTMLVVQPVVPRNAPG